MDAARNKDGSVTVTAEGNESNRLMKAAPGITYEMSLTVDSGGNYGLRERVRVAEYAPLLVRRPRTS